MQPISKGISTASEFRRRAALALRNCLALLAALVLALPAVSQDAAPVWTDRDAEGNTRVHLYFFWSETCPHCQAAHPFITAIPGQRPWVELHAMEVSRNPGYRERFAAMTAEIGREPEGVPTFLMCGTMTVGWQDAATTGAQLLRALDECRAGTLPVPSAPERIDVPLLGSLDPGALSLLGLTLILAGLDAFNPCAFFVLLFLLSLLATQKDRRRMIAVGGLFVAASGLMYFAFMAAWLNVFALLGAIASITAAAGVLACLVGLLNIKDFVAFHRGPTLSIPDSAKPVIYQRARAILQSDNLAAMLAATLFLAVAANFYELLCTVGFPMVYTRVLTLQEPSQAARYAWLALYNLIYVIPLALIVLVFTGTLASRKLSEREGRLLKLMSGLMMLGLGILLLLWPERVSQVGVAFALMAFAVAITALAARLTRPPQG